MNRANRPRLSRISGSSYASKLLGRAGDGSTLTLDFTTGVLDPRLTFTRDSNATFINSSGLVQWADSNIFYNSTWTDANNTPTAWSAGSGTASRSGETRTFTTSASQVYITQTRNTSSGIRYTASVEVTAVTGTQRIDDVIVALGGSSYQYYFNGSTAAGNTTLTPGVVGLAFTAGAATTTVRIGSGVQGTNTTGAVTLRFPQFEPGSIASRIYRPNDSTTRSYEAPRFDYDPTTLAPRGLLIEASANNLVTQSNGSTGVWTTGGNRTPTNNTTDLVSPDGTNNATKLVCGSAGAYASFATSISGLTGGATYTISYWIRGPVGHSPRLFAQNGTTGDVTATATTGTYNNTGWTRLTQTYTLPAATTQCLVYFLSTNIVTTGDTFYVYGFQMETGSGASSHIPTGANTGNRAVDVCYIAGSNFTSWFSTGAGTVLAISDNTKSNSQNLIANFSDSTANNYIRMGDNVGGGTNELLLTAVGGSVQGSADSLYNPPLNTVYKTAYAWGLDNFACVANGGTVGTDSTGSVAGSGVITSVTIGLDFYQTSGPNDVFSKNGHIRLFKYWPTRLPNAQLQSLTT